MLSMVFGILPKPYLMWQDRSSNVRRQRSSAKRERDDEGVHACLREAPEGKGLRVDTGRMKGKRRRRGVTSSETVATPAQLDGARDAT
ncbi:hypothetical protein M0804_004680 [Polistes exclamans]|nr:hypothetical protein M0804_004680 [Polistes exclamans]